MLGRNKKLYLASICAITTGVIYSAAVFAAQIDRGSYGTIHGDSGSANFQIDNQVADPAVGRVTSSNYILEHYYTLGTTTAFNHCTNSILDYDEVQIDCGGSMCQSCTFHCSNSIKDYDETGVDCGGAFCSSCGGGGGGGGGGSYYGTISFSGLTSPGATVNILKDGQAIAQILANNSGNFSTVFANLSAATYRYTLSARDTGGLLSGTVSYTANLPANGSLNYTNILLPPTGRLDNSEVKKGEPITVSGLTAPLSTVNIILKNTDTNVTYNYNATADAGGRYSLAISTGSLPYGNYTVSLKTQFGTAVSELTAGLNFTVGEETIVIEEKPSGACPQKGDLNGDCRVNLVDFSIAAYWYKRTISAEFAEMEAVELSNDRLISLVDFSILAYYWTG